jgi:phosphatidylinositol alpha-1,6-mannosyltransferase
MMPAPALLVSENFPPAIGGSAVLLDNIYSRLPVPVTVITDDAFPDERRHGSLPVLRRRLRTSRWGLSAPRGLVHHLATAAAIRRCAARMDPRTVVHCGRILPEGVAARFARMAAGPPFVCWAHGEDLATAMSSRELTWVTRWVLRGASATFANSQNTKAFLSRFDIDPTSAPVVYPGVDCSRFRPDIDGRAIRRRHGLENALVLLSVGRLQARKGHDVAVRAVAALAPRFPDIRYLIIGTGEERARLEQLAVVHGVHNRVTFVGAVSDQELPAYYAACDIFVLPNRVEQGDFEGFGIVFLEAAACGRAVVGGASGGVTESVAHGSTGLLVDGESVEAVVAALGTLARSPEVRQAYGIAGRKRVESRFTWEASAAVVARVHGALSSEGT